jgi:hypothetical protein
MSDLPVPHSIDDGARQQQNPIAAPDTRNMVTASVFKLGKMAGGEEAPE